MEDREIQFAQIEVLPSEHAGKILGAKSLEFARNFDFWFSYSFVGFLFAVAFMTYLGLTKGFEPLVKTILFVILCSVLSLLVVVLLIFGQKNRWLRHIAWQEINRRPDKIVNPSAANVRFVEVVPKGNWNNESLEENAVDVGFLAVDFNNGCLLFEGDNERYRIPAQAIIESKQDYYSRWKYITTAPSYGHKFEVRYFFVVVTVNLSGQSFEIPFRIRFGKKLLTQEQRRFANFEFLEEIHKMQRAFLQTS